MNGASRVLFVCGGNTCRSPIAVAMAHALLKGAVSAESAGIDAYGDSATPEAAAMMQQQYGIDISGHRPRDIEDVELDDFDLIVAMEPYIARDLEGRLQVPRAKVVVWDVEDPFGGGEASYRRCVDQIRSRLHELEHSLSDGKR